ncbi:MAG: amidohydrolase family protein [Acidimicrobiales bacterium]|nr:amidohydrolase family protein [Acidimicrobiales bacterium]
MTSYDLIIRGGTVHDGTASPGRTADVAIVDGMVAEVGRVDGSARSEIDADGAIVTPGFVDVHTHYDGQVTWDPLLRPSSVHGVTTMVMGNCGVGFAPAKPDEHQWLIGLMEGVEGIPGSALAEGISWGWESFPEYLDALDAMQRVVDIGAQVPHGALRAYVMGERGARNEVANADDLAEMARIVQEAIEAGALGFSTSRTLVHRAADGELVPGTTAGEAELLAIGSALAAAGSGVFEVSPLGIMGEDLTGAETEAAWMRKVAAASGRPVTYGLVQHQLDPTQWRRSLELAEQAEAAGARLRPQVASRPTTLLIGLQTFHPFARRPSYRAIAHLPVGEQAARMADPEVRARILAEADPAADPLAAVVTAGLHNTFPIGDPPDYEPSPAQSVAAIAEREGRSADEVLYDLLIGRNGTELLMVALLGYADQDLEAVREMLEHPLTVFGLGDGGAHCNAICDASMTTYLLTHWARDRTRGPKMALETVIHKLTRQTAELYGLLDRGVLAPGYRADVNVIDAANLVLHAPVMVDDLPAGGRRFLQDVDGYLATILRGQVTWRNGEHTGALPGELIRGPRPAAVR